MTDENKGGAPAATLEEQPKPGAQEPAPAAEEHGDDNLSYESLESLAGDLGVADLFKSDEKPKAQPKPKADEKPVEDKDKPKPDDEKKEDKTEDGTDADEDKDEDEEGEDKALKFEGLTPKQQERLDRRVGKLTAKASDATRLAADEKKRADDAEAQITELKKGSVRYVQADIHPLLLVDSEADLEAKVAKLREHKKILRDNWDGYEPEKDGERAFTAEEVRNRYSQIEDELETVVPQARARLAQRKQVDSTLVKQLFPDLLNPRSESFKKGEQILDAFPALRAHPKVNLIIGQMILGEKALKELIAAKAAKPGDEKPDDKKPADDKTKKAPAVPAAGAPGRSSGAAAPKKSEQPNSRVKQFVDGGATKDALADAIDGLETDEDE